MRKPGLLILILIWGIAPLQAATTINPDDSRIRYTGRWDHSSPDQPWAYWIGSSIKAGFTGSNISVSSLITIQPIQ